MWGGVEFAQLREGKGAGLGWNPDGEPERSRGLAGGASSTNGATRSSCRCQDESTAFGRQHQGRPDHSLWSKMMNIRPTASSNIGWQSTCVAAVGLWIRFTSFPHGSNLSCPWSALLSSNTLSKHVVCSSGVRPMFSNPSIFDKTSPRQGCRVVD